MPEYVVLVTGWLNEVRLRPMGLVRLRADKIVKVFKRIEANIDQFVRFLEYIISVRKWQVELSSIVKLFVVSVGGIGHIINSRSDYGDIVIITFCCCMAI